jgi:hypothetical protein
MDGDEDGCDDDEAEGTLVGQKVGLIEGLDDGEYVE